MYLSAVHIATLTSEVAEQDGVLESERLWSFTATLALLLAAVEEDTVVAVLSVVAGGVTSCCGCGCGGVARGGAVIPAECMTGGMGGKICCSCCCCCCGGGLVTLLCTGIAELGTCSATTTDPEDTDDAVAEIELLLPDTPITADDVAAETAEEEKADGCSRTVPLFEEGTICCCCTLPLEELFVVEEVVEVPTSSVMILFSTSSKEMAETKWPRAVAEEEEEVEEEEVG